MAASRKSRKLSCREAMSLGTSVPCVVPEVGLTAADVLCHGFIWIERDACNPAVKELIRTHLEKMGSTAQKRERSLNFLVLPPRLRLEKVCRSLGAWAKTRRGFERKLS